MLTRALPLTVIAAGSLAGGIYVARAPARAQRAFLVHYVSAWQHRDYKAIYALLAPASQGAISSAEFIAESRHAAQTATLTGLRPVGHISIEHNSARVRFIVSSSTFGRFEEVAQIPLVGSGGGTRVRYETSLLFPGLKAGEALSRKATLGERGSLLAANGETLAAGDSLSTSIPEVAGEIVGNLGAIPASQAASYAERGYPPHAYVGQDGLEQIFERQLAGRPGGQLLEGRHVIASAAPINGTNVTTTINPELELDAINALDGHYAGITVMNARSGALEAVAGIAFTDVQPPGSTFKIITSAAALQAGITTLNTEYPFESSVEIAGFKMQNADKEVCGGSLINAFATSCDTTFAPLGDQVGAQRLVAEAKLFGFDEPSGIASALTSTIPSASAIGGQLSLGASAIGQGLVQASTLEMADVGATIANDGERPVPKLNAKARTRYVKATTPKVAGEIQKMMEAVVAYGTGTAELADTANKKNDAKETDAWFVAYAPVPDPKVVICALFPNAGYGGDTAAPVVKELLEQALGIS